MTTRGSTSSRGYGGRHQALRKQVAALVASGSAVCWRCRHVIQPGTAWDLGHSDLDRTVYMGPEHARCNRSSAATRGNRMRGKRAKVKAARRVIANVTRDW